MNVFRTYREAAANTVSRPQDDPATQVDQGLAHRRRDAIQVIGNGPSIHPSTA